jgi:hypothetical protein
MIAFRLGQHFGQAGIPLGRASTSAPRIRAECGRPTPPSCSAGPRRMTISGGPRRFPGRPQQRGEAAAEWRICGQNRRSVPFGGIPVADLAQEVAQPLQGKCRDAVAGRRGVVVAALGAVDQGLVVVGGEEEASRRRILEAEQQRRRVRWRNARSSRGNRPASVRAGRPAGRRNRRDRRRDGRGHPVRLPAGGRPATSLRAGNPWRAAPKQPVAAFEDARGMGHALDHQCVPAGQYLVVATGANALSRAAKSFRRADSSRGRSATPRSPATRACQWRPSKFGGPSKPQRRAASADSWGVRNWPASGRDPRRSTCLLRLRNRRPVTSSSRRLAPAFRAAPRSRFLPPLGRTAVRGPRPGVGAERQQRPVVVEHFFEVRDFPALIDAVAAEAAADLVVDAAFAHAAQRGQRHPARTRRPGGAAGKPGRSDGEISARRQSRRGGNRSFAPAWPRLP